jgi:hypothetical protein
MRSRTLTNGFKLNQNGNASRPVSRVLSHGFPRLYDHSSGTSVAGRFAQPTRATGRNTPHVLRHARSPYSVLLPVGFTLPPLLPEARCALTAPFHPSRAEPGGLFSVALSLGLPPPDVIRHRYPWSPDFPPPRPFETCGSGRPADWQKRDRRLTSGGQMIA